MPYVASTFMAEFAWEARARTGELRKGTMEAENVAAVEGKLRHQQLSPLKVRKNLNLAISFGSGVDSKDLVTFTRQFATMIDAGLPLVQCLDILGSQTQNKALSAILRDVKSNVEQGSTFSEALRRHPKVFDELFVNLIQAGEVGGILDAILNRLAVYIEKRVKLLRQVRGALTYPSVVVVVAGGVMAVLMVFVIPAFENMFKDFGSKNQLPKLTQIVMAISKGFVGNLPWVLALLAVFLFAVRYIYRTPRGKHFFHRAMLVIPVVGSVLQKIAVARFTRTLGTLLQSGVPILDALEICAKSAGNVVITDAIMHVRTQVSEGKNMAQPLLERPVFPSMVVQMIAVGEQTGALDQMLNKIADFYEEEVDVAVGALTSFLEPLLMVVVGGLVGVVMVAMYLPIFDLAGNIKGD